MNTKLPDADANNGVKDDAKDILIGSAKVTMNGQGARLIALKADKDELKKVSYGANIKVECKGAQVTVLSARGREVTTVVVFEHEFGDGDYYKITTSNNASDSKYINGSYFVRKNSK